MWGKEAVALMAMTFEKLYPWAKFAVQRIERGRRQTISMQRTAAEATDAALRLNKRCGTPGSRGVRYVAVRIKRHDEQEEEG